MVAQARASSAGASTVQESGQSSDALTSMFIADSGSQRHILSKGFNAEFRRVFENIRYPRNKKVQFGSGNPHEAREEVDFGLARDALYVPTAHNGVNLLSLPILEYQGCTILLADGQIQIFPPDTMCQTSCPPILEGKRCEGLYYIKPIDVLEAGKRTSANVSCAFPSSTGGALSKGDRYYFESFHRALCHCSRKLLIDMAKHQSVTDLHSRDVQRFRKQRESKRCLHCPLARFPLYPVAKHSRSTEKYDVGESWSVDILGPYSEGIGDIKYYYLARDKISGYLIEDYASDKKTPLESLDYLCDKVRTLCGKAVKRIHCDSDSIFLAQGVERFLLKRNVKLVFSPPGEHRMSGAIERMVRPVNDRARCALIGGQVPVRFWPQAVGHAVIVTNRLPVPSRFPKNDKRRYLTPHELLTGVKPSVGKIPLFGAACVVRTPVGTTKLKSHDVQAGQHGVLLGAADNSVDGTANVYLLRTGVMTTTFHYIADEKTLGFTQQSVDWFTADKYQAKNQFYTDDILLPGSAADVTQREQQKSRKYNLPKYVETTDDDDELGVDAEEDNQTGAKRSSEDSASREAGRDGASLEEQTDMSQRGRKRQRTERFSYYVACANYVPVDEKMVDQQLDNADGIYNAEQVLHRANNVVSDMMQRTQHPELEPFSDSLIAQLAQELDKAVMTLMKQKHSWHMAYSAEEKNSIHKASSKAEKRQLRRKFRKIRRAKVKQYKFDDSGIEIIIPKNYDEAMSLQHRENFEPAIISELSSVLGKNTLGDQQLLPDGFTPLDLRWVFDVKQRSDGSIERYKARLVVKGYNMLEGVDYHDTYAPVATKESIRLLFSLAAKYRLHTFAGDFTTAFLNGVMEEEVYINWIEGLPGTPDGGVFRLKRALYGTKQAAREWYKALDKAMKQLGYFPTISDPCLYVQRKGLHFTIVAVYVDDVFGVSTDSTAISTFHKNLSHFFEYKELGPMSKVLGMRIVRTPEGHIIVSNAKMIHDLILQYEVADPQQFPRVKSPGIPGNRLLRQRKF
jgi:hypothetical protein